MRMDGILERSFILSNLSVVVSLSGVDLFSLGAGGQKGAGGRQSQGLLRVHFGSEALLPDYVCSFYTDCLGGRDGLPRATGAKGRLGDAQHGEGARFRQRAGPLQEPCGCVGTTAALLGISVGAPTAPRGLQASPPPAHCPELARVPAPHRTRRSSPGGRCQGADCAGRCGPGARDWSGLGVLKPEPLQPEGRNLCL